MTCVECRAIRAEQMKELLCDNKENCREAYDKGYQQGRADAIDECLVIVKFHANSYDGIFWAIRELEKLKENENEVEE